MNRTKQIAEKLNLDTRGISNIIKNDDLCDRILNESPIWLADYQKKEKIAVSTLKRLVKDNIVSSFSNTDTKGSKIFVFENELAQYESALYHPNTLWKSISDQTNIFLIATKKVLDDRHYEILSEYLNGMSIERVSIRHAVSYQRIRQIVAKSITRVHRYTKFLKQEQELEERITVLSQEISNMEKYLLSIGNRVDGQGGLGPSVLSINICDVDFSVRAYNCLKASQISTLGELVAFSRDELLSFRNFGKKSITEIEYELKSRGLSLK